LTLTDNWINFHIRYISDVRDRRLLQNKIGQAILSEIERSDRIKLGTATLEIMEPRTKNGEKAE